VKSITRFVPIVVVLSLLTSLFLVAPVSAASTGTVELDKTYVTSPGGTITVTLTDSDLNVGVAQTDVATDFDSASLVLPALSAGGTFFKRVPKFPILDNNADGNVDFRDVVLDDDTAAVLSVLNINATGGLVTFHASTTVSGATDPATGDAFTISYTAADVQTHQVKITSTQDGTGFNLMLKETGAATGVFTGSFNTGTSTATSLGSTASVTSTGTLLTGTIVESSINVDLNGDGDTDDSSVIGAEGSLTANEVTARLDSDGDGTTTAADAGVDLNNDGDATDTAVAAIDVAGIPDSTARPVLNAATGGIITASYTDGDPAGTRTGTATVETTKPTISVSAPSHDDATKIQVTRLIVDVTDADSQVSEGTIDFVIDSATDANGDAVSPAVSHGTITTSAITSGFRAEANLSGVPAGEIDIVWHAVAQDKAGNEGQSDSDSSTEAFDGHSLRVDTAAPGFADPIAAETGQNWDGDAIVTDATEADRTIVRVIFNEDLDGDSVHASDFEVDGDTPSAANWYSGAASSVFLTVDTSLASNAKPGVALVGEIQDKALNAVSTIAAATAVDGIATGLSVSVEALDKAGVSIDVTADEPLLTAPTITVNGSATDVGSVSVIGTNAFRADYTPTAGSGIYNVQVSVSDTAGNIQTAGTATSDADGAILFQIDGSIPDPATVPADGASISDTSPFIEITWADEATEYGIAAAASSTSVQAPLASGAVDMDTYANVTLTKLTLDGVDILGTENKEGDSTWVIATDDLALEEHELIFSGVDEAGNEKADVTVKFTVVERAAFEISLSTGWNLISFPGAPKTPAINDVISAAHPIDTVLTYDPRSASGWQIARRGDDGLFSGIDNLSQGLAYWVRTTRFESLDVDIDPIGGGTSDHLPTISLATGWNLVPVIDVKDGGSDSQTITVADYFKTVSPERVYSYSTAQDRFEQVGATGSLTLGQGYYVYMAAADVLVP